MQKMLKVTETEETIGFFCHIFIFDGISIRGGGQAPGYAYGSGIIQTGPVQTDRVLVFRSHYNQCLVFSITINFKIKFA